MLKTSFKQEPGTFRIIQHGNDMDRATALRSGGGGTISLVQTIATSACVVCGQIFAGQNLLAEHMQMCHPTEVIFNKFDYSPYQQHVRCGNCGLSGGITSINGEYKCIRCCNVGISQIVNIVTPQQVANYQQHVHQQPHQHSQQLTQIPHATNIINPQQHHIIITTSGPPTNNSSSRSVNTNPTPSPSTSMVDCESSGGSGSPGFHDIEIKQEPKHYDDNSILLSTALGLPPPHGSVLNNPHPPPSPNMTQRIIQYQQQQHLTTTNNKIRHKCPECPRTFKTHGTLDAHRKIHSGEIDPTPKERPFSCTFCGKCFTQSNTLKQHTRIHTGEKPFTCNYCEKSFSVKDYLTKHIRTHTGEKPYVCNFCDKRFTQRSALTVHTNKLHPV